MIRSGKVVQVNKDSVTVAFDRPEACANCNGCLGKQCTRVDIEANADLGDILDVQMPDQNILKASAITYLLPVVLLVAGMFAGDALYSWSGVSFSEDLFMVLCAFLFLLVGLILMRIIDRRLLRKDQWKPVVLSVHKEEKQH